MIFQTPDVISRATDWDTPRHCHISRHRHQPYASASRQMPAQPPFRSRRRGLARHLADIFFIFTEQIIFLQNDFSRR